MPRRLRAPALTVSALTVLALTMLALTGAAALWPAAAAAQSVTGQASGGADRYSPSPSEWWLAGWHVPQQVWPLSEGAGQTVAVVDTGVQADIPDLRGVVVPGGDMLGNAGNGEIDFDRQVDGHGTAVAALIAGQGRGTGTVGIAPQSRILSVHVDTPGVAGDTANLAAGIEFAASHGASVINVSLGPAAPSATSCDSNLQDAVAFALQRGAVVIASAGDTNVSGSGPVEPASCAGVLAVGGVEQNGSLWPDTVRQPYVSVAAPADHMVYVGRDGRYSTAGAGTSAAAPLVAGVAALIRSRYPSMPWYQVDQRLTATATAKGSPVPSDGYGYGIINPARAVNAAAYPVSTPAVNPVLAEFDAWLASSAGQAWSRAGAAMAASPVGTQPSAAPAVRSAPVAPAGTSDSPERMAGAGVGTAAYTRPVAKTAAPWSHTAILAALGVLAALVAINIVVAGILGARSRGRSRRIHQAAPR
jgi:type VII secretion-associated serine protease mycosin